jgi:hypothetical protein
MNMEIEIASYRTIMALVVVMMDATNYEVLPSDYVLEA